MRKTRTEIVASHDESGAYSEDNAGPQPQAGGQRQDSQIDPNIGWNLQLRRCHRRKQVDANDRQGSAQRRTSKPDDDTLRQQLPDYPRASCPKRGSHREFAASGAGLGKKENRGVHDRDDHEEAGRAQKQQKRRATSTDLFFMPHHGPRTLSGRVTHTSKQGSGLGTRLFQRHAFAQQPETLVGVKTSVADTTYHPNRSPDVLDYATFLRQPVESKAPRQDSNDLSKPTIQFDRATDGRMRPAKPFEPEPIADDDDGPVVGSLFGGLKQATDYRADAEQLEKR